MPENARPGTLVASRTWVTTPAQIIAQREVWATRSRSPSVADPAAHFPVMEVNGTAPDGGVGSIFSPHLP